MLRIVLQIVVPILLPFAVYALWMFLERRRALALEGSVPPIWSEGPWVLLLAVGIGLAAVVALSLTLVGERNIEGRYVPPRLQDGQVIPGHVEAR